MSTWLHGGRIVTPTGVIDNGAVVVRDGVITDVGDATLGRPEDAESFDLAGLVVLPGFIDLHVHGGGGATFDDGADAIAIGLAAHRAHGTTRSLVSLVTAPFDDMVRSSRPRRIAAADPTCSACTWRDRSCRSIGAACTTRSGAHARSGCAGTPAGGGSGLSADDDVGARTVGGLDRPATGLGRRRCRRRPFGCRLRRRAAGLRGRSGCCHPCVQRHAADAPPGSGDHRRGDGRRRGARGDQ